jgi:hypothetical protein
VPPGLASVISYGPPAAGVASSTRQRPLASALATWGCAASQLARTSTRVPLGARPHSGARVSRCSTM